MIKNFNVREMSKHETCSKLDFSYKKDSKILLIINSLTSVIYDFLEKKRKRNIKIFDKTRLRFKCDIFSILI